MTTIFERGAKIAGKPAVLDKIGDKVQENLQRVLEKTPARRRVEDALNGTWLGHPVHPPLTDVPVGAWTLAGIFDALSLLGVRSLRKVSTITTAVGVLSAIPTAASGAVDWQHTRGEARRLGVSHALLNSGALACYILSLACRLTGKGPGILLGFAGLGLASASSYLGGHLVLVSKVGIAYDAEAGPPQQTVTAIDESQLTPGVPTRVEIEGYPVLLLKDGLTVRAFADTCPHMGCSLASGSIEGNSIRCGCHGSAFHLADGSIASGPSAYPLKTFPTLIRDGKVLLVPGDD